MITSFIILTIFKNDIVLFLLIYLQLMPSFKSIVPAFDIFLKKFFSPIKTSIFWALYLFMIRD